MAAIDKIVKIITLLSSESAGEVTAAASAIGRMLVADGKDWHWLTNRLSGGASGDKAQGIQFLAERNRQLLRQLSQVSKESADLALKLRETQGQVHMLRRQVENLTKGGRPGGPGYRRRRLESPPRSRATAPDLPSPGNA